jgi:hypothetical protein
VANPISNNNSSAIANNKSASPEQRGAKGQEIAAEQQNSATSNQSDDAVTVSRAAEVLSQASTDRGQGVIQSAEHASAVAQQLKAQFESNPAQALAGQSNNVSTDIMELIKAK